jgi:hypothetical protein
MNLVGAPGEWSDLIESLVPDILALIISTLAVIPAFPADSREDSITEQLCRLLRMNRTSGNLPLQIHTQMVELDPSGGRIKDEWTLCSCRWCLAKRSIFVLNASG